jgi:hypothetical protein
MHFTKLLHLMMHNSDILFVTMTILIGLISFPYTISSVYASFGNQLILVQGAEKSRSGEELTFGPVWSPQPSNSWGTPQQPPPSNSWGTPQQPPPSNSWGTPQQPPPSNSWGSQKQWIPQEYPQPRERYRLPPPPINLDPQPGTLEYDCVHPTGNTKLFWDILKNILGRECGEILDKNMPTEEVLKNGLCQAMIMIATAKIPAKWLGVLPDVVNPVKSLNNPEVDKLIKKIGAFLPSQACNAIF